MEKRNYTIICGFDGIGKSVCETYFSSVCYLRSDDFDKGAGVWPCNYVDKVEDLIAEDRYQVILLCSDNDVREELQNRHLEYFIAAPEMDLLSEYTKRWFGRGDNPKSIMKLTEQWNPSLMSVFKDNVPILRLEKGEFLSDILYRINSQEDILV